MATTEAAHVAHLRFRIVLPKFIVYVVLRSGDKTGTAITHVGLLPLVVLLLEIIERTGAVHDRFTDPEVVRDLGQCGDVR
jgi:hypothetical protein